MHLMHELVPGREVPADQGRSLVAGRPVDVERARWRHRTLRQMHDSCARARIVHTGAVTGSFWDRSTWCSGWPCGCCGREELLSEGNIDPTWPRSPAHPGEDPSELLIPPDGTRRAAAVRIRGESRAPLPSPGRSSASTGLSAVPVDCPVGGAQFRGEPGMTLGPCLVGCDDRVAQVMSMSPSWAAASLAWSRRSS